MSKVYYKTQNLFDFTTKAFKMGKFSVRIYLSRTKERKDGEKTHSYIQSTECTRTMMIH